MRTLAAFLAMALSVLAQDSRRKPVPDEVAQKEAEKLIREVFKEEYASSSASDRKALASKLLEQGREAWDDAASQYVLFREAREMAVQAGEPDMALQAVQEMDRLFAIDGAGMQIEVLSGSERKAKTPEEFRALAETYLKLTDEAMAAFNYETASKAVSAAARMAKKAKDDGFRDKVDAMVKEVSERKARYEPVRKAREKLARNPGDAGANLVFGRFLCFEKEEWEEGLALLSKGSDENLRSLATRDLAAPLEATAQAEVGDGWWNLAEKESGDTQDALKGRAIYWYEKAVDGLSGAARTRVENLLAAYRKEKSGLWEELNNPALFGESGKQGDPIALNSRDAALKRLPKGEFDGITVRIRFGRDSASNCGVLFGRGLGIIFVPPNATVGFYRCADDDKWDPVKLVKIQNRQEYVVTFLLIDGDSVLFLDGKEVLRSKTSGTGIKTLQLSATGGQVTFDRIKLRHK